MRPSLLTLIRRAAREAGCRPDDILGPRGSAHIAAARQRAMADAHAGGWSLTRIAQAFRRHHTTVLHAVRLRQRGVI